MSNAHILGFPRIGAQRELKFAVETFWRAPATEASVRALGATGSELRRRHWGQQRAAGLGSVVAGDFHWYDQVLSTLALLGALPQRFGFDASTLSLEQYFAMARGNAQQPAMEMTKWFDTNYHYLVPEFSPQTAFEPGCRWLFDEIAEAYAAGHTVKPVLLGPLTLLWLGKEKDGLGERLSLLPRAIKAYGALLAELAKAGIEWVQIDEPILALDLPEAWRATLEPTYCELAAHAPRLLLTTYFESVEAHLPTLVALPVAGLHIDAVRAPQQVQAFVEALRASDKVLSIGIVDGRNVWRNDLDASLERLRPWHEVLGERLWLATSCSLLHVPVDLDNEARLDAEIRGWLAFATQKLSEVTALRDALDDAQAGRAARAAEFDAAGRASAERRASPRIHNQAVKRRLAELTDAHARRQAPYAQRACAQRERFDLPLLPTTTIGSFPQTGEIRQARAEFKRGALSHLDYLEAMRAQIRLAIAKQEAYGLDVLVHGEAERNDMVEYFGELLWGYAFTENGWVQSYGSRCVKPPLIFGDVYMPEPMTVNWSAYAQSLTSKPVKGMLTGPVTMLQWSFVRDDQPRETTALQIALALRDEVKALESAGIGMIQIDEPAFREGLPLKKADWPAYLDWAVRAFRVASSGVRNDTQIHTHMCYSEFGDILPSIAALDADVISIETTRSAMELLSAFETFAYPNEIGPGVYDIHSPRVPNAEEMKALLRLALQRIPASQLWVNPDCGLKTRDWKEVDLALANMVAAAQGVRAELTQTAAA